MTIVALTREDGGVSIMQLCGQAADAYSSAPAHAGTIIDVEINEANRHQREGEKFVSWRVITQAEFPPRYFRNAWIDEGKTLSVHMPKAREIHRDRLRALRVPQLAALDVESIRASEAADRVDLLDVAERKQMLRDVTDHPEIAKAKTPEELMQAGMSVIREHTK